MRRIHQADDGIIHVRVEFLTDDKFRLVRQRAKVRRRHRRFALKFRIMRDEDENQPVLFGHRIAAHLEPARLIGLLFQHARHVPANTIGPEAPAMIGAFHSRLARRLDHLASRKRHQPMRTDIAQRKGLASVRSPDHNRLIQHDDMLQPAGLQLFRCAAQIPAIGQPAFRRDAGLSLDSLVYKGLRIGHAGQVCPLIR